MKTRHLLVLIVVALVSVLAGYAMRCTADVSRGNFESNFSESTILHIERCLEEAERDIEKFAVRRALFEKKKVDFLIEDIMLIGTQGTRVMRYKSTGYYKVLVKFDLVDRDGFLALPKSDQRVKMEEKAEETGKYLKTTGIVGLVPEKDLKVEFLAKQPGGGKTVTGEELLVAQYNEGRIFYINKKLKEVWEHRRRVRSME